MGLLSANQKILLELELLISTSRRFNLYEPSHPPTHVKARSVRISCSMLLDHDVLYFTLIIVLKGRKIKSMVGPIISLPIECEA